MPSSTGGASNSSGRTFGQGTTAPTSASCHHSTPSSLTPSTDRGRAVTTPSRAEAPRRRSDATSSGRARTPVANARLGRSANVCGSQRAATSRSARLPRPAKRSSHGIGGEGGDAVHQVRDATLDPEGYRRRVEAAEESRQPRVAVEGARVPAVPDMSGHRGVHPRDEGGAGAAEVAGEVLREPRRFGDLRSRREGADAVLVVATEELVGALPGDERLDTVGRDRLDVVGVGRRHEDVDWDVGPEESPCHRDEEARVDAPREAEADIGGRPGDEVHGPEELAFEVVRARGSSRPTSRLGVEVGRASGRRRKASARRDAGR